MKKVWSLLLACCMTCALSAPALADDYTAEEWSVVFNGEKLEENYPSSVELADNMQPGDSLTQVIHLKNNGSAAANWYITNEVLESLEDNSAASGGAYTYVLAYNDGTGTRDLYNSSAVGGDGSDLGLGGATQGLEDYVMLGELPAGSSGTVSLTIGLDGMSQINSYQNTNASVRVNFAVEEVRDAANTTIVRSVKTGDWMKTMPFILLTAMSGLVLLGFAVVCLRKSKEDEEGACDQ